MEAAIKSVVGVYLKSAKGKENLGGKEFQCLVKSQLKNILTDSEDNDAVKKMSQQLDNNEDGKVGFQEYMNLIGYLAQSLSDQRCLEKETQAGSSTQETQAEAAANAQAEPKADPKADPKAEPKAEPQAAKEVEKEDKPVVEKAVAKEQKPEEEKKTDVEQEGAKVEENKAEEKIKTEEAS